MDHVVVVGGGAAGLGAAWYLRRAGVRVTLIDKNPDMGGRCRSHQWNGHWLIRGAAAFVGGENEPVELATQLGIYKKEEIHDSKEENDFSVLHRSKGIVNLGGFNVKSILASSLIPTTQKIKLAAVLPKVVGSALSHDEHDPTSMIAYDDLNACEYFRKYSPAFVDYILEPIMNQYCGYGEDDYSLAWLVWLMGSPRAWSGSAWTFDGPGVGLLSSKLQEYFENDDRCDVVLGVSVSEVRDRGSDGVSVDYSVNGQKQTCEASAVVMAVPGSIVNSLMPGLDAERKAFFSEVKYVSHHIYHQIVDKPSADYPFSLLLPTVEGYQTVSNLWLRPHTDPSKVLAYGEIKGKFCEENRHLDDNEMLDVAWKDIVRALPQFSGMKTYERHLQRNDIALCSRRKGYTTALKKFNELPPLSNVAFAGDYLINSTVGQSLFTGKRAAEQLLGQK